MEYTNRLKGAVTQTLLKSLLEDAGYRIVPLGIEEVIREFKVLDKKEYLSLGLPDNLRKLPDFLVTNRKVSKAYLLEVKYRRSWNQRTRKSLEQQLKIQVKVWNPLYFMLFLGEPYKQKELPIYWMRVTRLSIRNQQLYFSNRSGVKVRWNKACWSDFSRVQDVFKNLDDQWEDQTIEKTKVLLHTLKQLDKF